MRPGPRNPASVVGHGRGGRRIVRSVLDSHSATVYVPDIQKTKPTKPCDPCWCHKQRLETRWTPSVLWVSGERGAAGRRRGGRPRHGPLARPPAHRLRVRRAPSAGLRSSAALELVGDARVGWSADTVEIPSRRDLGHRRACSHVLHAFRMFCGCSHLKTCSDYPRPSAHPPTPPEAALAPTRGSPPRSAVGARVGWVPQEYVRFDSWSQGAAWAATELGGWRAVD